MPKKLPPYFLKGDRDSPCLQCNKIRNTCRFCNKCNECCECSPQYICPHCHGYTSFVSVGSDIANHLKECKCEYCSHQGCIAVIDDPDNGNYLDDGHGNYKIYCDKCYPKVIKNLIKS